MGKARNLADSFLYDRDLRYERFYFHPRDFYSLTAGIHFKLIHPQTKLQVFFKYVQGRSQTGSTGAINPPLPIGAVSERQ